MKTTWLDMTKSFDENKDGLVPPPILAPSELTPTQPRCSLARLPKLGSARPTRSIALPHGPFAPAHRPQSVADHVRGGLACFSVQVRRGGRPRGPAAPPRQRLHGPSPLTFSHSHTPRPQFTFQAPIRSAEARPPKRRARGTHTPASTPACAHRRRWRWRWRRWQALLLAKTTAVLVSAVKS